MSYGVRYKAEFNSVRSNGGVNYTLNILQKDYTGDYQTLYLAESPVVQEWQEDDPKAPIKGCSLKVNVLTSSVIDLETFYSDDDTKWLVELNCPSLFSTLFIGYLVQDDCKELQVGWEHALQLSATDNLGILKKVDFYSAATNLGISDPKAYLSLREILRTCLKSTNIELAYFKVLSSLYPNGGANSRWVDDTYLSGKSFLKNETEWMSCYEVLERIMTRFYATCFQANANWYIIRWGELYQWTGGSGANLIGNIYDLNFDFISSSGESSEYYFLSGNDMETGVIKSIERPYAYVKETFDFQNVNQLLCNADLNQGVLYDINDYGTYAYWFYTPTDWKVPTTPSGNTSAQFSIVAYIDNVIGKETDRYMSLAGPYDPIVQKADFESCAIEVEKDQTLEYGFSYRTRTSDTNYMYVPYRILLQGNTGNYHLDLSGNWIPGFGVVYNYFTKSGGEESADWHTSSIKTSQIPESGYIWIQHFRYYNEAITGTPPYYAYSTFIKGMTLRIESSASNTSNTIGQTNTDSTTSIVKNNKEIDIYLDDCISPTTKGTLFLDSYTGVIRNKTEKWSNGSLYTNNTLGEITTSQELFQRSKTRAKYEGNLLSLIQSTMVTPASVFFNNGDNDIAFVVGSLSINYREEMADITLYELWNKNDDLETFLASDIYEFSYLYEKK